MGWTAGHILRSDCMCSIVVSGWIFYEQCPCREHHSLFESYAVSLGHLVVIAVDYILPSRADDALRVILCRGPHLHRSTFFFPNPLTHSGCMQGSKQCLCYASGFLTGQNMQLKSLDLVFYRPTTPVGGRFCSRQCLHENVTRGPSPEHKK